MDSTIVSPLSLAVISVAITAIALVSSIKQRDSSKLTRKWVVLFSSPGLMMMVAFYSFAARMHSALNGWPDFYGTEQLPSGLLFHDDVAAWMFTMTLLIALCIPLALALFYVTPRLRPHLIYPAFLGSVCWLCIFMTQLAPTGFLNWWWD